MSTLRFLKFSVAYILLLFLGYIDLPGKEPDALGYYHVSLVELLAVPEKFDKKKVIVVGFFARTDFEDSSLYLTEADAEVRNRPSSIWVGGFRDERIEDYDVVKSRNNAFLKVGGEFRKGPAGHMGLWSGEVANVDFITIQVRHSNNAE